MKNKYYSVSRAALLALALTGSFAFNTRVSAQALPGSIWYNGDRNHVNGLANERDDSLGFGLYNHVFRLGHRRTSVACDADQDSLPQE